MFLGDHVLFDITPNITTWPDFEDPLGTYVHSLMDISICLLYTSRCVSETGAMPQRRW